MDRGTAVVLTVIVGGMIALQAPVNSGLGRQIGTFQGVFLSLLIGTVVMLGIAALARGGLGAIGDVREIPRWYYLTGGLLGAAYVTVALVTVRTLGAGGLTSATIGGQLAMAATIDHFGWLGIHRDPLTPGRIAGFALLFAGTYLVVRP
jgi:transporter family-2 protein